METITIYENVEREIRKTFEEEETKQDKEYFLREINRVLTELWREID